MKSVRKDTTEKKQNNSEKGETNRKKKGQTLHRTDTSESMLGVQDAEYEEKCDAPGGTVRIASSFLRPRVYALGENSNSTY